MRVAVLNYPVAGIYGGGQLLCRDLCDNFNKYGYESKVFDIPTNYSPMRNCFTNSLAASQMCFDFADLVIPTAYFTLHVQHDNCVPWIIHQINGFYDKFDSDEEGYQRYGSEGAMLRRIIQNADVSILRKHKRLYTISPAVTEMLLRNCGLHAETLTIPFEPAIQFGSKSYGDYIFYPGRVISYKRPLLAVQAMQYVKTGVKLVIAGVAEDDNYKEKILKCISEYSLSDKVTYIDRFISEREKADLFAHCLASMYLGVQESYWTMVATEAAFSEKPIIAPVDTGATSYLVLDGETGYRPANTPEAIAEAMDAMFLDKSKTKKMGINIRKHIETLVPTWEQVVRTLAGEWS